MKDVIKSTVMQTAAVYRFSNYTKHKIAYT